MYYKTNEKDISLIFILHILQFSTFPDFFAVDVDILDYWNLSWKGTLIWRSDYRNQTTSEELLTPNLLCWSRQCLSGEWSPPPPPSWARPWPQPGNINIIYVKFKSNVYVTNPSTRNIKVSVYVDVNDLGDEWWSWSSSSQESQHVSIFT